MQWLLFATALFIAFSNGANDNFKGFATVWGSNTLSYRRALALATLATALGSLLSLLLADGLVQQFSGKGLVPDNLASAPEFILSVSCGAGLTVFIATRLGLPVSTTHALIGGLIGAGIGHSPALVNFDKLLNTFLLPLLLSPLLAGLIGALRGQGLAAFEAAALAVWLAGRGAERLARRGVGPIGLTASETAQAARAEFNRWLRQD